jgi:hypothetical protein
MKVLLQLLIISQIVLLGACSSSTKMRDTWHADNFHPEKFDNVLVVGQTTNTSTRLIWESSYAHELETYGITAIQSNHVLGNGKLSKEKVLDYISKNEVGYVLVTRVEDIKETNNYVAPTATIYSTGGNYYPGYYGHTGYGYWGGSSTMLTTEGYMDTYTTLIMETTIYNGATKELVWAAKTDVFEPSAVSKTAEEHADLTMKHLTDK